MHQHTSFMHPSFNLWTLIFISSWNGPPSLPIPLGYAYPKTHTYGKVNTVMRQHPYSTFPLPRDGISFSHWGLLCYKNWWWVFFFPFIKTEEFVNKHTWTNNWSLWILWKIELHGPNLSTGIKYVGLFINLAKPMQNRPKHTMHQE